MAPTTAEAAGYEPEAIPDWLKPRPCPPCKTPGWCNGAAWVAVALATILVLKR
jgi:hypothetical protein